MDTKTILFHKVYYMVPKWVKWVGRNADGSIIGFDHKPHCYHNLGEYFKFKGESCVIYNPHKPMDLQEFP